MKEFFVTTVEKRLKVTGNLKTTLRRHQSAAEEHKMRSNRIERQANGKENEEEIKNRTNKGSR